MNPSAPTVVYWKGNLDVDGCAFIPLITGSYQLRQYTNNLTDGSVKINTYRRTADGLVSWGVYANFFIPLPFGLIFTNTTPTANNDAVQVAAVAGQALAAHQYNGGMGYQAGTYRIISNEGCGAGVTPPTDSCYKPSDDTVYVGTTRVPPLPNPVGYIDSHWKFVVAHEMGHQVQDRVMGLIGGGYNDNPTQALCRCDHYSTDWSNRAHCIQSREYIGAGQNEGFGHAFATHTFNYTQYDESKFVYYKPYLKPTGGVTYPPVDFQTFATTRWMENYCTAAAGHGTEFDWLQFYTTVAGNYLANNTPFSALFNIYQSACTLGNCGSYPPSWTQLDDATEAYYGSGSAHYLRFRNTGINTGVDY